MAAETNVSELITRNQFETYIDIDGTNELIGDGFTTLKESKNAKEYTRKYVNMKTEKTDVIGYSPSIEYSLDVYSQSPVVSKFVDISDKELVGNAAVVTITNVNCWQKDSTTSKFIAVQRNYSVIPSDKGDGTDALIYSGTMKAATDIIEGTFDPATKTFTAKS